MSLYVAMESTGVVSKEVEKRDVPFSKEIQLLDTITGMDQRAPETMAPETGVQGDELLSHSWLLCCVEGPLFRKQWECWGVCEDDLLSRVRLPSSSSEAGSFAVTKGNHATAS